MIVFCALIVLSCALSAFLRHDLNFDLINYHYYNAHAFLHDRMGTDFFPAFANTYLNPLIELPLYFLIKYLNNWPALVYGLQGLWLGLSLYMLYKIACLFFKAEEKYGALKIVLVLFIATVEKTTWIQIGASTNEIPMLFLSLSGLYMLLRMLKYSTEQTLIKFFIAGFILGAGMGLKLTMSSVCAASGIMLILSHKLLHKPIKDIGIFALGGVIGFLLFDGWLMIKLWNLYSNPFFPYLNNIFNSEYADPIDYRDTRNIRDLSVFFPYLWLFKEYFLFGADPSGFFYIGITLLQIALIRLIVKKRKDQVEMEQSLNTALIYFLICYYFCWYWAYGYLRYMTVFMVLLSILVMQRINFGNKKACFWWFVLIVIGLLYRPGDYLGHEVSRGRTVIDVEEIFVPENTVIYTYGNMTAGFAAFSTKGADYQIIAHSKICSDKDEQCGITGHGSDFMENEKLAALREKFKAKNKAAHVIYIINQEHYPFFHLSIDHDNPDSELSQMFTALPKNAKFTTVSANVLLQEEKLNYHPDLRLNLKNNYYCRPLRHNIYDSFRNLYPIYICVPKHLKDIILNNGLLDLERMTDNHGFRESVFHW